MECPVCKRPIPEGVMVCSVCGWKADRAKAEGAQGLGMRARLGRI